jgi:hypothetical protein
MSSNTARAATAAGQQELLLAELDRIHDDLALLRGAFCHLAAVMAGQRQPLPGAPVAHGRPRRLTVVRQ